MLPLFRIGEAPVGASPDPHFHSAERVRATWHAAPPHHPPSLRLLSLCPPPNSQRLTSQNLKLPSPSPAPSPYPFSIILIVRYLRDNLPDTHVVLSGILPRGGTNPLYRYRLPNVFTQAVDQLSWRIK